MPTNAQRKLDIMLLAEMPSMNEPHDYPTQGNFDFDVTAHDKYFQEMMTKHGIGGRYVTDIVKNRDYPRRPTAEEVKRWLPFLVREIEILGPKGIIVIGKVTYHTSFSSFVSHSIPSGIEVDWIYFYPRVARKQV